jgi:hypothetical protein
MRRNDLNLSNNVLIEFRELLRRNPEFESLSSPNFLHFKLSNEVGPNIKSQYIPDKSRRLIFSVPFPR